MIGMRTMKPTTGCLISLLGTSLLLAACRGNDAAQAQSDVAKSALARVTDPQVPAEDSATLAADNAAFALAAYQKLAATNANLVFSPTSLSIALAMTYAGAAGGTASEMAAALHFSLPPERLHPAFDALDLALTSRGEGKLGTDGGPMRLNVVNAAWAERTYAFKADYLDILGANYGAGVNLLDFAGAADPARVTINDWVAQKTANRIRDLLPPDSIDNRARLVLTNAVYFNAAWKQAFDPLKTFDSTFSLLDGGTANASYMRASITGALASVGGGCSALALPYQDDRLSLLLVIPDAGTFTSFEAGLDAAKLNSIVQGLAPQSQNVVAVLPRFKLETKADMADLLRQLGMVSAFDTSADFSAMDGTRQLCISKVIHQAFIDVGEQGTEAAAATGVVVRTKSADLGLVVQANRPFLYFIRDQPTGAIVFMGRVLDPSKN